MDKVEASKSRPIFALFVNGTAPETERLVELAKHHEMVTFTSIDCMNESVFCEKYSIRDTPAAKLIRGDDSLYWRSPDKLRQISVAMLCSQFLSILRASIAMDLKEIEAFLFKIH